MQTRTEVELVKASFVKPELEIGNFELRFKTLLCVFSRHQGLEVESKMPSEIMKKAVAITCIFVGNESTPYFMRRVTVGNQLLKTLLMSLRYPLLMSPDKTKLVS